MYAILRFEKLKTDGAISASASHMMRTRPTHNADPSRLKQNRVLSGSKDPAADVARRLSVATQRRSNSVLAIEVLASASPEWFATATKEQKSEWLRSTRSWLETEFGRDNVASLHLHVDEKTPHLTGFIVPIDPVTQRLNAARWLDGSAKMAKLQDGYATAVSLLGLKRGLEGSDAIHTTVKQFYGAIQSADVPEIPEPHIETPPPMLVEKTRRAWAEGQEQQVQIQQDPVANQMKAQARAGIYAERKVRQYQKTAESYRQAAHVARDIPLQEVAERLGLTRDKADAEKWRDAEGSVAITIKGSKWFDHKEGRGGGGAIDLAMHCTTWDFKQTIAWLGHGVGITRAARAVAAKAVESSRKDVEQAMAEKPVYAPPEAVLEDVPKRRVRNYLAQERKLSPALVDRVMTEGKVYPDKRGNAIFVAVDAQGVPQGAEIRGTGKTPFHGLANGSSREACFTVSTGPNPKKLVITESAIDALSYAELHQAEPLLVASTAGARPNLPEALAELGQFDEVVVAYDADKTGRSMGDKLMEVLRTIARKVTRSEPSKGKDWNEMLKDLRTVSPIRPSAPQPSAVRSVRR